MSPAAKPLNALLSFNILHSFWLFFHTDKICEPGNERFSRPEIQSAQCTGPQATLVDISPPRAKAQSRSKARCRRPSIPGTSESAREQRRGQSSRPDRQNAERMILAD